MAASGCARPGIVLAAAGDLELDERSGAAQLGSLGALLPGQLRLLNLEGPLTTRGAAAGLDAAGRPTGAPIRFRARPGAAALLHGRIDVVSLANNHALDQGLDGRDDTARALFSQGIAAAFSGHDAELGRAGQRVIVVARDFSAGVDAEAADQLGAAIQSARARGAVVVSLHWGQAGSLLPTRAQRELAARAASAGASVVVGHGPHTVQGIERRGRAVIAYSVGNLAFSCRCTDVLDAYVLVARIERDGRATDVRALPIAAGLAGGAPRRADDPGLYDLIINLSRDLGSKAERVGDAVRIQ